MNTMVTPDHTLESGWAACSKPARECASRTLVKTFGDRIYSIARHITQSEQDAADVLIDTFLEICDHLEGRPESGRVWLRLVSIAVRESFSKLANQQEGLHGRVAHSSEDLVVRELFVWGDTGQSRLSLEHTNLVLEHGLRNLDPMCRTVFLLRDIEGIPTAQIANIVNRSVSAVEVCLLRARLQLRETMIGQIGQQS